MIKVLHIITRMDMGGSAQNTLDTCLRLDHREYAVTLMHGLSRESDMTAAERTQVRKRVAKARQRGVRIISLAQLVRRIDVIKDIRAFFHMLQHIRRMRPVIVHTHTSKAGFLGRTAAWLAGVPIIVQTPHGHVFYGHFGPAASKFFLLLERLAAGITDRLVALTEQERSDYVKYKVAPDKKLAIIHSGVDLQRFQAKTGKDAGSKERSDFSSDRVVIGFVGWLLPIKGVQVLLKALEIVCDNCPQAHLVLVGKGELEAKMKTEVGRLGLSENVEFMGWRKDIDKILPLFDIFVLPSLNEGMGRVLVEAMAAARPIVASDTGGIPDLVQHGENGLLVPPGDHNALARALLQLIRQPDEARRMGRRGRHLSTAFSVEKMVKRIEGLYAELLLSKDMQPLPSHSTLSGISSR